MDPADEPAPALSEVSTDRPSHEEQAVSEESTTNERPEDHVWTAAELAAEGWTTADLKGAGWTDAHLESIGWPLESAETKAEQPASAEPEVAEESAPIEPVALEEPAPAETDASAAVVEPQATSEETASEETDKVEEPVKPKRRSRARRAVAEPVAEEAVTSDADAAAVVEPAEPHDEPTLPGLEGTGTSADGPEAAAPKHETAEDVATEEGMPEAPAHEAPAPEEPTAEETAAPEPVAEAEEPEAAPVIEPEPTPAAVEPEPIAVAEPEPIAIAEPEPVAVAEPEPEPEPAPVTPEPAPATVAAAPVAAPAALALSDLTPDEIERALELGESLSEILARKNATLPAAAAAPQHVSAVSPATAFEGAGQAPAGSEPSPESSTSASGGGDRGGDDSDDPDPAVALAEPPVPEPVFEPAPAPVPDFEPEPEVWEEAPTAVIPRVVASPAYATESPAPVESTTATRAAASMMASEAATETGAEDVERVEYRPGNGRRYLFGAAFIVAAVLSVVAVFWAIQNPGIAPSVTAGCLVVLTGALWWSLMAWSPRIIAIGHGVLEFSQGGHVERFNLLDPDTNIAVGPDPTSRTWRTEVIRANGTKVIVRPDDVRPQQFSALIAKYREEAEASRR